MNHMPVSFRNNGSLGLSKAELDAYCQPSGLYPTCEWEPKQIRRLISNALLAPRLVGSDSRLTKTDRECPICFMYYSSTNLTKCCSATLCTECYLQIKKPNKDTRHGGGGGSTVCPFCNDSKMGVKVQGSMKEMDVVKREEEEQRVIEATIRSRVSELNNPGEGRSNGDDNADGQSINPSGSFGSSLENYNNRARTQSNASSNTDPNNPDQPTTPVRNDSTGALQSLAMSPADRTALESEMRAQLSHETHLRVENEAEEARLRHAREYYGGSYVSGGGGYGGGLGGGGGSRSHRQVREARLAELTGLLERMGAARSGGGAGLGGTAGNNEEEGDNPLMAREGGGRAGRASTGGGGNASLSRLLRAMEASNLGNGRSSAPGGSGRNNNLEDLMRLEQAFFLGMDNDNDETTNSNARRSSRRNERNMADEAMGTGDFGLGGRRSTTSQQRTTRNSNNAADTTNNEAGAGPFGLGSRPSILGNAGGGSRSSRFVRNRLSNNRGGVSSTHLDTAELLMRGVSEEEQLAMAIAMSMQESATAQQQEGGGEGSRGEGQQQVASRGTATDSDIMRDILSRNSDVEEEDDSSSGSSASESSASSGSSASDSSGEETEEEINAYEGGNNGNDDSNNDNEDGNNDAAQSGEDPPSFSDLAEV